MNNDNIQDNMKGQDTAAHSLRRPLQIAIVGGGAAGFFAAIEAKSRQSDAQVTVFERNSRPLAKVAVTGGGRCNLTNSFEEIKDLRQAYPRGHNVMKRLLRSFDHRDTWRWFEQRGVRLVTQDDQCVFPQSQDAMSIVHCLTSAAARLGVRLLTGRRLTAMSREADGRLRLEFADGSCGTFDRVAVTTGGAPRGEGLGMFASLGHSIEPPVPSLFTLNVKDRAFQQLMGTVVEHVTVSIPSTRLRAAGALLVTHWGISGPAVLKLTSHGARYLSERQWTCDVAVNWTGERTRAEVEEEIGAMCEGSAQRQVANVRPYDLPSRLWLHLLDRAGIAPERRWQELGRKGVNRMVETLVNYICHAEGRGKQREEFVTCGGVSLSSVNINTLESKACPHLYFAGEVLDIDAITGGFNLQAAWTTGYVVGQNIVNIGQ